MIFARLFEDAVLIGRFAWFYYRAPQHRIGFAADNGKIPARMRVAYAWKRATML